MCEFNNPLYDGIPWSFEIFYSERKREKNTQMIFCRSSLLLILSNPVFGSSFSFVFMFFLIMCNGSYRIETKAFDRFEMEQKEKTQQNRVNKLSGT